MILKIKKIHPKAKIPKYALPGDAGMDLFAVENQIIHPKEIADIKTGFEMELPSDTVGLIWDKGSTAHKGLKTMGGVFDESYRGEVLVIVQNVSDAEYHIESGDKIAQLLIQKIEYVTIAETKELSSTIRGKGRFGSTGRK